MKKILQALFSVIIVTILVGGVALAAGGQLTPFRLIGSETTVNVQSPLNASWGAASFSVPISNNVTFWPGDKIAEASVTIENISPNSYEVYFNAQPETVKNDVWPVIEVKLLPEYGYASSTTLAAGEKRELLLEIRVASYSQLATFQGLTVYPNYGPPVQPGGKG